jgi:hypothetical protein
LVIRVKQGIAAVAANHNVGAVAAGHDVMAAAGDDQVVSAKGIDIIVVVGDAVGRAERFGIVVSKHGSHGRVLSWSEPVLPRRRITGARYDPITRKGYGRSRSGPVMAITFWRLRCRLPLARCALLPSEPAQVMQIAVATGADRQSFCCEQHEDAVDPLPMEAIGAEQLLQQGSQIHRGDASQRGKCGLDEARNKVRALLQRWRGQVTGR